MADTIKRANGHHVPELLDSVTPDLGSAERVPPDAVEYDLDRACAAVFALRSDVPDNAFTAPMLGTRRGGSAVLIGADGLVLTIGYLVSEAEGVTLTDATGTSQSAVPIAYDFETGFGLLRMAEPPATTPLAIGKAASVPLGTRVVAASHGGPRGARMTALVDRREFAGYWEYLLDEALFTTPPHPAWSGAALLAPDGSLIGIGSLLVQDARDDENAPGNMFVPIDLLPPILDGLLREGRADRPQRPWLGAYVAETEDGLIIGEVVDEGPAERAGLRAGDIIEKLAGAPVRRLTDFLRRVWALGEAGTVVPLTVQRDRASLDVRVRSANRYSFLRVPRRH